MNLPEILEDDLNNEKLIEASIHLCQVAIEEFKKGLILRSTAQYVIHEQWKSNLIRFGLYSQYCKDIAE